MNLRGVYPKKIGPVTLGTSATLYYTADKRVMIERFNITNWSGVDASVTIYLVSPGTIVGNSTIIIGSVLVPATDISSIVYPVPLEVGDKIYALAGALNSINLLFNINDIEMSLQ